MKKSGIIFLIFLFIEFGNGLESEEEKRCEVISNSTINGIEYRECKDGRLMKVNEKTDDLLEGTDDINLSEVGVISGDEEFLKDLSKIPKKDNNDYVTLHKHDAIFGKQREIREKINAVKESLKKKRSNSTKNQGRKFGVIYKHNGFDEGQHQHHHDEDEESDEEIEAEEDAMTKATIGDSVSTTVASSSLKLGEGINETPDDVDVKELIALAHHKNYHHKETATTKFNAVTPQPSADSESLKSAHPDTFQPHDTAHFGNLRYLDFAPETKDKQLSTTETPSEEETSESLLLPETANNNNNQQQQLPPNPYFLVLANNPIKVPSVERSMQQQDSENVFNDVRKVFASATPTSDFSRRHDDSTSTYYSMIKPQIILAFLAPITAFLIYCSIVLFYIYRKKSSSKRKLLPTKNCRYQHFHEDAEATVGFAV